MALPPISLPRARVTRLLIMLVARQVGFAQVELPLEPTPRLILQSPLTIEIIDALTLGADQQQFDFVWRHCWMLGIPTGFGGLFEMLEASGIRRPKRPNDVIS